MIKEKQYYKTSLYDYHINLDAKVVPFAGFLMPVNYKNGILYEYNAVRNDVGMFDVSHMGQLSIKGEKAIDFLNNVSVNNVYKLSIGDAQYSMFCNDNGGIIDDIIIYKKNNFSFLVIVNASNIIKDYDWLVSHNTTINIKITDLSKQLSIIAIQGPNSKKKIYEALNINLNLDFYTFKIFELYKEKILISRT